MKNAIDLLKDSPEVCKAVIVVLEAALDMQRSRILTMDLDKPELLIHARAEYDGARKLVAHMRSACAR